MTGTKPKYRLIADQLMRDIEGGRYPVGGLLPTESRLMQAYGVSRYTVRNAVQDLKSRGVVSSRQGQGYKVTTATDRAAFAETIQSIDELIAFGQETRRVLLAHRIIEADQELADLIGCSPGRRFVEVRMLRKTLDPKGHAIALVTLWMDALLEPVVDALEDLQKAAAEIIRDRFGHETRSVVQTIQAASLDSASASVLGAEPNDPALVVTRLYAEAQDKLPFLIARSLCRADRFCVVSKFTSPS
ncbi:MAG: GntR family transcriptional regulator [Geminicoccaceae bacterium]